jgi:ABC-type Fe3+/spermidine/putrescine transport system ATPase subunit
MVFQNYALFPTMTVGENVGYGLKVRGTDKTQLARKVAAALERVDMGGMETKPVTQLSGGQQQRVALARAIVVEPSVLLFDEPLSNLDVALREQTRRELKRLQREIGITSIYVTHDQQEALALSDRLAVLRDGRVQQEGRPEVVYFEPANEFVARFMGGSNVFSDQNQIRLLTGSDDPDGKILSVRPEHWIVQESVDPEIAFHIRARQFLGVYNEFTVGWNGTEIRLWLPPDQSVTEPFTALPAQTHWLS